MAQMWFYDQQIRRFTVQFLKLFSHFQVKYANDANGNEVYVRVPVKYGDGSRMANSILGQNSENTMPVVPMIACTISGLEYDRSRMQDPSFVDRFSIRTRKYDEDTQTYLAEQGTAYSIERMMPVPYKLKMKAEIWAANTEQKLQIFEQIAVLFNPSLEIQSTDNYIDWSSLSVVELLNSDWSSKPIPAGTTDQADIQTMEFEMPIWISPPAKVKKMGVIFKIISSMYDPHMDLTDFVASDNLLLGTRQAVTFGNYGLLALGNELRLLRPQTLVTVGNDSLDVPVPVGDPQAWPDVLEKYGTIQPGITQIRLTVDASDVGDNDAEIIGTVAVHPMDSNILLFTVDPDTIPANTLDVITAVINPLQVAPGLTLPAAALGQRYLLLDDVGNSTDNEIATAWAGTGGEELIAKANDIVEWDGLKWVVAFDAAATTTIEYTTNLVTSLQYKWKEGNWVKAWEGVYDPLQWRIVL
jgi:T4-like virus Myoviridae tail sheath stabiliser